MHGTICRVGSTYPSTCTMYTPGSRVPEMPETAPVQEKPAVDPMSSFDANSPAEECEDTKFASVDWFQMAMSVSKDDPHVSTVIVVRVVRLSPKNSSGEFCPV